MLQSAVLSWTTVAACAFIASAASGAQETQGATVMFSGRQWVVRDRDHGGPGPNDWSRSCVSVDDLGRLHLKITHRAGRWQCPELYTTERLGFGQYQFQVIGRLDKLDRNVVLGLFHYPSADVGKDGTNEIDIEFARWAIPSAPMGNYTVWPSKAGRKQESHTFDFTLTGTDTTQRYSWKRDSILFQSLSGHRDSDRSEISRWLYRPSEPEEAISQKPMPLHINLWLFRGKPPLDGKEVEVIIKNVTFTPVEDDAPAKK